VVQQVVETLDPAVLSFDCAELGHTGMIIPDPGSSRWLIDDASRREREEVLLRCG